MWHLWSAVPPRRYGLRRSFTAEWNRRGKTSSAHDLLQHTRLLMFYKKMPCSVCSLGVSTQAQVRTPACVYSAAVQNAFLKPFQHRPTFFFFLPCAQDSTAKLSPESESQVVVVCCLSEIISQTPSTEAQNRGGPTVVAVGGSRHPEKSPPPPTRGLFTTLCAFRASIGEESWGWEKDVTSRGTRSDLSP